VTGILERVQETWLSQAISQSTWGYPIVGAIHVLAIALCAGPVLMTDLRLLGLAFTKLDPSQLAADLRWWKWVGLGAVFLTGALMFISLPVHYYASTSFRIKMGLIALLVLNASTARRSAWLSLTLWVAIIFAARGIAFY
jgi:hypothetical protein